MPRHIPETVQQDNVKFTKISMERHNLCMTCGQCMAACPNDAIHLDSVERRSLKTVLPLEIDGKSLHGLMEQRRSVRRYKDKSVPRETLDRIIDASRVSPAGTGSSSTGVLVIDKQESLEALSAMLHDLYQDLDKNLHKPIARFIIRRRIAYKLFHSLQDFVMPGMRWYLKWKKGTGI